MTSGFETALSILVLISAIRNASSFLQTKSFQTIESRRHTSVSNYATRDTIPLTRSPEKTSKKEVSNWPLPIPYSKLTIGVPKENGLGEKRVGLTPKVAGRLIQEGFNIRVEKNAGSASHYRDIEYAAVGAKIVGASDVWRSDVVVKVQPPTTNEAKMLSDRTLVSFFQPTFNRPLIQRLQQQGSTVFAMDSVPRFLSRAQAFDALSSQATIAGYRAVVECMHQLEGFFPSLTTPAGDFPPAKVLILGAGVAGIAAISTAKNMGAEVYAYDVRESVRNQVEAAGGFFLQVPVINLPESELILGNVKGTKRDAAAVAEYKKAEAEAMRVWSSEADIIITTALIPGRQAPKLITWQMVKSMKPGAVILDMAASLTGGNVEGSIPDEINIGPNSVKIIGYTDLPSRMSTSASALYANNIANFLLSAGPATNPSLKGKFFVDYEDPAVREMLILDKGELRWPNPNPFIPAALVEKKNSEAADAAVAAAASAGGATSAANPGDVTAAVNAKSTSTSVDTLKVENTVAAAVAAAGDIPPVNGGIDVTADYGITGGITGSSVGVGDITAPDTDNSFSVDEGDMSDEERILQQQIADLEAELGKYEADER